jgi:hypothetical protein
MAEPVPTMFSSLLCIVALIVVFNLGPSKYKDIDLKKSIEQSMLSVIQEGNEYSGNYSSIIIDHKMIKQQVVA